MIRGREEWSLRRAAVAALCAVALLQIALGLAGLTAAAFGVEWTRRTAVLDWQRAVVILAFGALAAHLLLGARRDPRVEHLGGLLLLFGLFFAYPPIQALVNALPPSWARVVTGVRAITVDAFTPALAWLFVRDFPRALEWPRVAAFVRAMIAVSAAAAAALIAVNVAIALGVDPGSLASFVHANPDSLYWPVVFGPLVPLIPFVLWRTRHAPRDERRRVGLFASGLAAAGVLPVAIAVLPPLLGPAAVDFIHGPWASTVLIPLNLLMILSIAATTTYAVVVDRVLDVRTVLRMAAQYWLATVVVAALAGIPFALVVGVLYRGRTQPLAELLQGRRLLGVLLLLAAGAAVLRVHRQVMLGVDRVFFRERYDPERILAALASESRAAESTERLARAVMEQIERALHPESIGILVAPAQGGELVPVASPLRTLPRESPLARRLSVHGGPLEVDLARPGEPLRDLPDENRVWLGDAGAALLVPLMSAAGELDGLLALGPKRSELPYSRQDRTLLELVAGAAGIGLENRRLRGSGSGRPAPPESRASECVACGRIAASGVARCPECGEAVREAALPADLFGKFRLERRIGEGGMGIVYGATDLALARRVALKTLPRTSPEDAERLRRESRAMAAVTHPNLALILGAETWQATPILVLEYLAGGTLEKRIAAGPLPPRQAFEIAARMARVLERVHKAGLLHRDVKPSNVGFTDEDDPKLLDFGLVQILSDVVPAQPHAFEAPIGETGFAGTPLYMSPEALDARRPDPGFDLWGLAIVAFEAATGRHPFERPSASATLAAIRRGWTDELREGLPPALRAAAGDLFESALAAERSRRPGTAAELAEGLRKAADALA